MKPSSRTAVVAVAMLASALVLGRALAQERAPRAPAYPRVAVCDVGAVFNGYQRRNDLNAQLDRKRQQAREEDKKRLQAVEALQKTLEQLKEGSREYDARLDQLQKLTLERRVWREFAERTFVAQHRRMMEGLYREIVAAVAVAAREKGFDLVLYSEDVEIASETTSELYNKIAQRKCLYHNPAISLTEVVLARVNGQYKARRK